MNKCDKCGEHVPLSNDASAFDRVVRALEENEEINWTPMLFSLARHLLPTEHCEGSPSRAQYLEGLRQDRRRGDNGEQMYPLDPANLALYRRAHQILRELKEG